MSIHVHIVLPICLFSSSVYISSCLIHVCVFHLVYALPSFSTFIYNYRHLHMYICDDYCVITYYKLNILIIICLCVPASKCFARCLHTCDPMCKGLYINIHTCLYFQWIHTDHVHVKNVQLCAHLPSEPMCAFFNIVFIRIYSIHLHTRSTVNVYTETVQSK